ncbi:glycosyltransferase family 2 protein [Lachnospiraceae bacterium JLR.KK008]
MDRVSFVIPCYRSELTLERVVEEICRTMDGLRQYGYEIVLVNDCSPDHTLQVIHKLCEKHNNITGVSLARNFGQHAALMAGFRHVTGDIVICLDDDGQTPAEDAGRFLAEIEAGRDVVYARYSNKQHTAFRNFGSKVNEIMTRFMLGKPKELYISSYFAARRFVIDEVVRYENCYPYVIGLVLRTTKNIGNVEVAHRQREVGHSGYTMKALLGLWFNGFTAFSIQPLRFATMIGVLCAGSGFLYGIYTVVKRLINPDVPIGFSSLMSALVFIGGMIMLMLGLIGEYVGRIYISLNNSPQYVIREVIGQKSGPKGHENGI